MNYRDVFSALENRLQNKENEERLHDLILHTSDVEGGEHLYSQISKAYYIYNNTEKYSGTDRDFLIAQLHSTERVIIELLNKQGWA